jgi:adenylate cyclase
MKHFLPNKNIVQTYFDSQFELENTRRERQRAGVLIIIFISISLIYAIFAKIIYQNDYVQGHERIPKILFGYFAFMILYESAVWLSLKSLMPSMKRFPTLAKFWNANAEVSILTGVIYLSSIEFAHPILMLLSPMVYLYFLFIILSTLRLSNPISVWTGLVAGIQYFGLSYWFIENGGVIEENDIYTKLLMTYAVKAVALFFSGVAAGFVATQIRTSVQLSIQQMETQEHIVEMFGQQVSPEVVEAMLAEKGILKATHRKVSVMFLDIRDFTIYADKHTAEEVVAYQNAFFEIVVNTVNEHNGIVNQFLGDGCMVTFGAPIELENPSENAVKAGLKIIEMVTKTNKSGTMPITNVGIGVHTGDAVVGNIGTETRQQYNITGTVVIQAARIEQLNKEYNSQMLVSQEVMDEISVIPITTKQVGSVHLKGMENEIFLWKLA